MAGKNGQQPKAPYPPSKDCFSLAQRRTAMTMQVFSNAHHTAQAAKRPQKRRPTVLQKNLHKKNSKKSKHKKHLPKKIKHIHAGNAALYICGCRRFLETAFKKGVPGVDFVQIGLVRQYGGWGNRALRCWVGVFMPVVSGVAGYIAARYWLKWVCCGGKLANLIIQAKNALK